MSDVQQYLQQHADLILDDLKRLVRAESPSRDKAAVDACGQVLTKLMAERLDATAVVFARTDYGNHLAFNVGRGFRRTAILGHFDTVWDAGQLPLREEGDKLFGPGVLDMKGGLIQAIWAVRALLQLDLLHDHEIRFLCSADEELGSPSSRAWIEDEAARCDQVLVVEPAAPHSNALKTERKGTGRFEITLLGRAAHAGNNPEQGVNAIHEMAEQVLALQGLNAPERGTTVNVGVARGGERLNVVPDRATLGVDLRVTTLEEAERVEAAIYALQPRLPGAQIRVSGGLVRPPLQKTPENNKLFQLAQAAARRLSIDLREASVGGGSDGNFTSALGIPTLDGLGATGVGPHAVHEHILISDLPLRAALLAELIRKL